MKYDQQSIICYIYIAKKQKNTQITQKHKQFECSLYTLRSDDDQLSCDELEEGYEFASSGMPLYNKPVEDLENTMLCDIISTIDAIHGKESFLDICCQLISFGFFYALHMYYEEDSNSSSEQLLDFEADPLGEWLSHTKQAHTPERIEQVKEIEKVYLGILKIYGNNSRSLLMSFIGTGIIAFDTYIKYMHDDTHHVDSAITELRPEQYN